MPSREPHTTVCAIVPLPEAVDPRAAFAPVADQPAVVRVVRSLLGSVSAARIVVAAAPALAAEAGDRLRVAGLMAVAVAVAPGSRRQALAVGLEHLGLEPHSTAPVLIGDRRWPLETAAVAASVISTLRDGHDAVVPMIPVTDTVKTVDDRGSVLATVDRSILRTVQYPRGFTAAALWRLVSATSTAWVDDEFTSALRAGLAIGTVVGDADARRFELPRDGLLLDAVIACRSV